MLAQCEPQNSDPLTKGQLDHMHQLWYSGSKKQHQQQWERVMARHHKGNYSEKHPPDLTIDPEITAAVTDRISNGQISCSSAFSIATDCAAAPSLIGTAIDLQEGRITKCQLGLFGYGRNSSPLKGADRVEDDLKAAIASTLVDGRLACKSAWQIADNHNLSRLAVARACESLGIRIHQCQLGAF